MTSHSRQPCVLITGATSGFGFEFAKLFAAHGYKLVLVGRNRERLRDVHEALIEKYNAKVIPLSIDLFNPNAAKEIYGIVKAMDLHVDILINDAGQGEYGKFIDYDVDRDVDIIQLNITSVVCLTKYFLRDMIAEDCGKILQISSLLGHYPTPLMAVHAASKAFVHSFTEGIIAELKGSNVTVTALLPGGSVLSDSNADGKEHFETRHHELTVPENFALEGFEALMRGESIILSCLRHHH